MQFLGGTGSSSKVGVTIWTPTDLAGGTQESAGPLRDQGLLGKQTNLDGKELRFLIAAKSVDDQLLNLCDSFLSIYRHLSSSASPPPPPAFGKMSR